MKIQRKDLLGVIQRVAPTCKTRTTLPILSQIRIGAMNGGFRATASNGDCFVSAACACDGQLDECCVSPLPLLALAGYGPEVMELTLDGERLKVSCGSNSKLPTQPWEEFPKFPNDGLVELGVNVVDLAEAINSVAWATDPKSLKGVPAQSVWINMDTKKGSLMAFSLDGRRMGWFNRKAIVPNCTLLLPAEHSKLIYEALLGEKASVSYNDSWVVVQNESFRCAVSQMSGYTPPMNGVMKAIKGATEVAELPLPETLQCLESMRSVAGGEIFVYGHATFQKDKVLLEYVGRNSEFHSSVSVASRASQSKAPATAPANVAGECPVDTQIRFDATLLHNVLNNTPGTFAKCKISGTNVIFESGDVTTALALLAGEYK